MRTQDIGPVAKACKLGTSYFICSVGPNNSISNPMLAETFEDVRMKFLAEKVSHNPVVIAYHAEGKGWELNATSAGKTKFWGEDHA